MTLTVEQQIDIVRDWTGTTPDDDTITATLARFVDATQPEDRAALAILRRRHTDLVSTPAEVDIKDDVGWKLRQDQLDALAALIRRLEAAIPGETVSTLPALTSVAICGPGNHR